MSSGSGDRIGQCVPLDAGEGQLCLAAPAAYILSVPTIAHLSDLHFGREDPAVVAALQNHLTQNPPDLVVASGDFTQRARESQFRSAASFFFSLPEPRLAVPGNHDLPLFNPFARAFGPLRRYQKHIHASLRPVFDDGQLCVVGLNTTRRLAPRVKGYWKDGIARQADLEFACHIFANTPSPVRVLVMHHPIRSGPDQNRHDVIPNSRLALERLAAAGADAILYGHLHTPHALFEIEDGFQMPRSMLCIMAGTATSVRLRGDWTQSYNRIWFDGDRCCVEVWAFDGKAFAPKLQTSFVRDESGWSGT